MNRYRVSSHQRKGTSLVELAVCLPFLTALIMGSIAASNAIFLKQTLEIASYEGARDAASSETELEEDENAVDENGNAMQGVMKAKGKSKQAKDKAEKVMNQRGVKNGHVGFSTEQIEDLNPGEELTVTVSAELGENSSVGKFFPSFTLSAETTIVKE